MAVVLKSGNLVARLLGKPIPDEGGGFENKPVAATALPSMKLVREADNFSTE
uniref:Uncharacterized protein n=1 Tax=Salix viminalis TaxID=40686 RepID=A0A6N2L7Y0_SALVM